VTIDKVCLLGAVTFNTHLVKNIFVTVKERNSFVAKLKYLTKPRAESEVAKAEETG